MFRIFTFLKISLALALIAFGILIVANLVNSDAQEMSRLLAIAPAVLMLSLAMLVVLTAITVALTVLYVSLRWIIVKVGQAEVFREFSTVHKLVALAAAFLLFPTALTSLFQISVDFGSAVIQETPRAVLFVGQNGFSCIASTEIYRAGPSQLDSNGQSILANCVPQFVQDTTAVISTTINRFFIQSGLVRLDLPELLFALLTFVLVAMALSRIASNMTNRSRFWLAYSAIAVFSIYLALSATLAVPLMQVDQDRSARFNESQLRTVLENIFQTSPIQSVQASVNPAPPPGLPQDWQPNGSVEAELNRSFEEIERIRAEIRDRINAIQRTSSDSLKSVINTAVTQYATEAQTRLGYREASRHYLDIQLWFQGVVDERSQQLNSCTRSLSRIERHRSDIRDIVIATQQSEGVRTSEREYYRTLDVLGRAGQELANCREQQTRSYAPPSRAAFGTSLGPVGSATRWLLAAESMPVTLITGLVGFGLLGSLVARFVRFQKDADAEAETIGEIATLVFSGFVAALVVYVASYGGLAIVSETESNPNPYIIFAACLVGAVYSSQVWEEARIRFLRRVQSEGVSSEQYAPNAPAAISDANQSVSEDGKISAKAADTEGKSDPAKRAQAKPTPVGNRSGRTSAKSGKTEQKPKKSTSRQQTKAPDKDPSAE